MNNKMPFTPKKEGGFHLNDGTKIPVIGIGTWDVSTSEIFKHICMYKII